MYDRTTAQGATFSMRGQLYRRHANATALSSSSVVSALGSESDDPALVLARARRWDVREKKVRALLLGLAKSIYFFLFSATIEKTRPHVPRTAVHLYYQPFTPHWNVYDWSTFTYWFWGNYSGLRCCWHCCDRSCCCGNLATCRDWIRKATIILCANNILYPSQRLTSHNSL